MSPTISASNHSNQIYTKSNQTQVILESAGKLVSSSKDGTVRAWDLTTQHCCQIVGGVKGEVWSLDVNPAETRVVTAATDLRLRVYAIQHAAADASGTATADGDAGDAQQPGEGARSARAASHDLLVPMGSVQRQAQERAARVRFDPSGSVLGCLVAGKSLELFSVRGEEEARKKMKRRRKRRAEKQAVKAAKSGAAADAAAAAGRQEEEDDEEEAEEGEGPAGGVEAVQASDELGPLIMVVGKHKVKSFAFAPAEGRRKGGVAQVAMGLADNSVEVGCCRLG